MVQLNNDWDHFHVIQKKVLKDLIKEMESLEIPPDWRPREVLSLVLRKLKEKEAAC